MACLDFLKGEKPPALLFISFKEVDVCYLFIYLFSIISKYYYHKCIHIRCKTITIFILLLILLLLYI